jgi:peptidoglycan hydrolase-like protein with peptidoglycan-binding domain
LQLRLRELGYFGYVENTGYLGSVTLDAILHFQADHKLPETGVVDLMTIEALNRLGEDAGAGTGAPMPDRQGDGTP